MPDSYQKTCQRLRDWQNSSASAWDLRRIIGASDLFSAIAQEAMRLDALAPKNIDWRNWWAFRLEQIDEDEARKILVASWNAKAAKTLADACSEAATKLLSETLSEARERTRLAREIDSFLLSMKNIPRPGAPGIPDFPGYPENQPQRDTPEDREKS